MRLLSRFPGPVSKASPQFRLCTFQQELSAKVLPPASDEKPGNERPKAVELQRSVAAVWLKFEFPISGNRIEIRRSKTFKSFNSTSENANSLTAPARLPILPFHKLGEQTGSASSLLNLVLDNSGYLGGRA